MLRSIRTAPMAGRLMIPKIVGWRAMKGFLAVV